MKLRPAPILHRVARSRRPTSGSGLSIFHFGVENKAWKRSSDVPAQKTEPLVNFGILNESKPCPKL